MNNNNTSLQTPFCARKDWCVGRLATIGLHCAGRRPAHRWPPSCSPLTGARGTRCFRWSQVPVLLRAKGSLRPLSCKLEIREKAAGSHCIGTSHCSFFKYKFYHPWSNEFSACNILMFFCFVLFFIIRSFLGDYFSKCRTKTSTVYVISAMKRAMPPRVENSELIWKEPMAAGGRKPSIKC